jgi:hypothetical protein
MSNENTDKELKGLISKQVEEQTKDLDTKIEALTVDMEALFEKYSLSTFQVLTYLDAYIRTVMQKITMEKYEDGAKKE